MGNNRRLLLRALLLATWLSAAHALGAGPTPQQLVDAGHLELTARLAPADAVVPGQKLNLNLTIATDRWFTGGTRITLPEVAGLVVLQTEQFATNASERRGEQDWVLQRWTLDVYPQRAGRFTIPPITVRVKVNGGEAGNVEGVLASPSVDFTVILPPALAELAQWVAAPEFTVSQGFDRPLENLQVGDAFEREIVLEATDVMAMMLPAFTAGDQPGLAVYPAPPVLANSSNRGQTRASRRQSISYVVEAEGQYLLPGADFFWWDTTRGELQVLSLPSMDIVVGAGVPAAGASGRTALLTPRQWLFAAAGLVLLSAPFWLAGRYLPRIRLARLWSPLARLRQAIQRLRRPALPDRLNPGSSAGQ